MKPSDLVELLETTVIDANVKPDEDRLSAMIWGAPGIGKSQIIKQLAKRRGYRFLDIRLSQMGPEDMQGVPFIVVEDSEKRTAWGTPLIYPSEGDPKTLMFFDEITHAPPAVRKSAFQIILDRQIGQHKFPKDTVIIAAGNRVEDRSGAQEMELALKNRFIHIDLEVDRDDLASWWVKNDKDSRILSFLRAAPHHIHEMPEGVTSDNAFPSPRTWDFASQILRTVPKHLRLQALKGTIGAGPAKELEVHLRTELPDMEKLLEEPWSFTPPEDRSVMYAIANALTQYVTRNTIQGFCDIAEQLAAVNHQQDFAVTMTRDLFINKPELTQTSSYIAWSAKHKHLVI